MARLAAFSALLGLASLGAGTIAAQPTTCAPQLVGMDRRGPAGPITRAGDRLYLGAGAAVVVVDTTDLLAPIELGHANLEQRADDLAVSNDVVVVAGPSGLEFVDVSDPADPHSVGALPIPEQLSRPRVDAGEHFAHYPAADGLHVVDFSDPANPAEVGFFPADAARDVALNDSLVYLLVPSSLLVLDVSEPSTPSLIASVPVPVSADERVTIAPSATGLATSGGGCWDSRHCYASAAFFGLADPNLPSLRSDLQLDDEWIDAVAFHAGRVYLTDLVYDLPTLTNPVYLGRLPGYAAAGLFGTSDPDHLFLADPSRGLLVEEVSDPPNAQVVASVSTPRETNDVYLDGTTAVVVQTDAVRTFDLAVPSSPVQLGLHREPNLPLGEEVRIRDHAYVTSGYPDYALEIFDLSDPTQPEHVGSIGHYVARPPAVAGNRIYFVDDCAERVRIFDVSNPAAPLEVGTVELDEQCYKTDYTAGGDRLFIWDYDGASGSSLLRTFDVSDPGNALELGAGPMIPWHWARSLVYQKRLILADEDRVDVVSVDDPSAPVRVGSLNLPQASWYKRRISRYGRLALVAPDESFRDYYDDHLLLVDLSDPIQPSVSGTIETPGDARGAAAGPGLIVVADGPAGFSVYSSCVPFADGFESGDASAWSSIEP